MADRINRKDLIVEVASDLFLKQGYEATSVRQIADEVGVTEAALYYHFKEGKQELLQAVIACQMPNFKQVLEHCKGAESLQDLIIRYGQGIAQIAEHIIPRVRWLISEFSHLSPEERNFMHQKQIAFHDGLTDLIEPFVDDAETASVLAWTMMCTTIGHTQLFGSLDMKSAIDFPLSKLMATLSKRLS